MSRTPADLPDDPAALKAMIFQLQGELHASSLLIEALRLRIARLRKQKFGSSSERIAREIEQLELALEDALIAAATTNLNPANETLEDAGEGLERPDKPAAETRRRNPRVTEKVPRERRVLDPGNSCPDCGGALRLVGEDMSPLLEMITAQLKLIEIARPKKSCRCCEKIVQQPAPSRPIPGSLAGPSLLAFILVSKFDDHLPLYRLHEIFERMGADIPCVVAADEARRFRPFERVIERGLVSGLIMRPS